MTEPRTLDYRPRLVEANRGYRVTADPTLANVSRYWVPGPGLDQGREGACVGFGVVGEAVASPVRVRIPHPQTAASDVYRAAQRIDEWEGESYEGTSVRAGMLVGRDRGWWSGFNWAFTMGELRTALEMGPVVIGVEWRSDMYRAPGGVLQPTGEVVGGHCILVTGYARNRAHIGPAYRLRNSWGDDWGHRGSAYIRAADLEDLLFGAGGEAAVPIGRAA